MHLYYVKFVSTNESRAWFVTANPIEVPWRKKKNLNVALCQRPTSSGPLEKFDAILMQARIQRVENWPIQIIRPLLTLCDNSDGVFFRTSQPRRGHLKSTLSDLSYPWRKGLRMRFDLKYMRMLTQTVPYNGSLKLKPDTGKEWFDFTMFSFISIYIILCNL